MEPIFIVVDRDCWSLFVRAIVAFADNSRLINNSRELNDKNLLINKR